MLLMVVYMIQAKNRLLCLCHLLIPAYRHLMADHQVCQLGCVGILPPQCLYRLAGPQNGNAVADRHHLAHLVGNEDHRLIFTSQPADNGKQAFYLLIRKRRCGFVQN